MFRMRCHYSIILRISDKASKNSEILRVSFGHPQDDGIRYEAHNERISGAQDENV